MGGAGDIWGISGRAFLLAYLIAAAAAWVATVRARRALADRGTDRPEGDLAAHPHHVAFLHAGPELAVYSALGAMHQTGTVATAGRGRVRAAGRLAPDGDPLEQAIHRAASGSLARHRLVHQRRIAAALGGIADRLVAAGLLLPEPHRARIRAVGWWLVGLAGVGLLRVLTEIAGARPVGMLATATACVAVLGGAQLAHAPRRSRAGDRILDDLRRAHPHPAPDGRPAADSPAGVALRVGLFGPEALRSADPVFAEALCPPGAAVGVGDPRVQARGGRDRPAH